MKDNEKKLQSLFAAVTEHLSDSVRDRVPETGSFRKVSVGGHCKGSLYRSVLSVEESYKCETLRWVTLGVYREGEDRVISNYLFKGTRQEVLGWLEDPANLSVLAEACAHLEEAVQKAED